MILCFFSSSLPVLLWKCYKIMLFYLRTTLTNQKSSQRASRDRLATLIIPIYYNISASKCISFNHCQSRTFSVSGDLFQLMSGCYWNDDSHEKICYWWMKMLTEKYWDIWESSSGFSKAGWKINRERMLECLWMMVFYLCLYSFMSLTWVEFNSRLTQT